MLIKKFIIGALVIGGIILSAYLYYSNTQNNIHSLYPRPEKTFVGDPMPYYDGNEFKIYYLEDLRDGQIGFHPFSLLTTKDFYHYSEYPNVIPFVNDADSRELALGTGSIIKVENTYHAFYTGHNGSLTPKETILHATSQDGIHFDKIPENSFVADKDYHADDFRDPFVFFEEKSGEYWMLITTRKNNQGVIAKYTSKDLITWKNDGVLFENDLGNDSNLECPSLVYFNGKWILAFSDQWDKRVVHYRLANSPDGPFVKPNQDNDYLDGSGFYAGRLVTNGDKLYVAGWIATKEGHQDRGKYNWAGNLAVHELNLDNDQLTVQMAEVAKNHFKTTAIPTEQLTEGQTLELDTNKNNIFEGTLHETDNTKLVTVSFSKDNHIVLDFESKYAYYTYRALGVDSYNNAVNAIPINRHTDEHKITIVKENEMVVIYLDGTALSNRMYETEDKIKISAYKGDVVFE